MEEEEEEEKQTNETAWRQVVFAQQDDPLLQPLVLGDHTRTLKLSASAWERFQEQMVNDRRPGVRPSDPVAALMDFITVALDEEETRPARTRQQGKRSRRE